LLGLLSGAGYPAVAETECAAVIILGCGNRLIANDLAIAQAASRDGRRIPFIVVTSDGSEQLAAQALRAGAVDYVRLPVTPAQLAATIEAAVPRDTEPVSGPDRMVAVSEAMEKVKTYLSRIAACNSNVLITGETGTGKELAAQSIHQRSARAAKPMITINCAAIPDTLIESELFGYERGAFTGAHSSQDGKLRLASGGTVFLDEIGDLSPFAQAKILRAIETGEIQRLGGRHSQRVDLRIIAATNRNLESDDGFRRDLYFRLNVARVHLPPLRERKEDIQPLAEQFRREFDLAFGCATTSFAHGVAEVLAAHRWPGNIRELRNVVEASFIDPGPGVDGRIDLPVHFRNGVQGAADGEREKILLTLARTEWNRSLAAKELQWSRMTLYRKMARYSISRNSGAA
jgi:DNA-binding NtrC family response regulator